MKLNRMQWNTLSNYTREQVAEHIDEGADLNFLGIWLEHDKEAKIDHILVASESCSVDIRQLLASLILRLARDGQLTEDEFLNIFAWVTAQRAKDLNENTTETPTEAE